MAFDKVKYDNDFARQNYDVIRALVPKGRNKDVKALAKARDMSVSQLVIKALESQYNIDLSKPNGG